MRFLQVRSRISLLLLGLLLLAALLALPGPAAAQDATPTPAPPGAEEPIEAPDRVDVQPRARDEEIQARLQSILEATGWFVNPEVQVEEGVVFLDGQTDSEDYREWAGNLARRTQDVVAVVNQLEVQEPPVWDFGPLLSGLREQARNLVRAVPLVLFGIVILAAAAAVSSLTARLARRTLRRRDLNPLLVTVIARAVGIGVFLAGVFVVFQVVGLTSVALTVLGGTGLLGLVLGIAFQDITENFLASILLSVQSPFRAGDLVEVGDVRGFVQALTTRATLLMTLDGNHVQIPNSTVYKATIRNFTSNPNRRLDFLVGIGYDESIVEAQEVALQVLADHPAVLADPEPMVLVDSLGSSTVNLRVYFWFDGSQYSPLKVKSSMVRLVKRAFQAAGLSMPGEMRELVFPQGIPLQPLAGEGGRDRRAVGEARRPALPEEPSSVSTDAEAGLQSESGEIEEQARRSRSPEQGSDLLQG